MPSQQVLAADLLGGESEQGVMNAVEAGLTALSASTRQLGDSTTNEHGDGIPRSAAAGIPWARCGDLPSLDAIAAGLISDADKLLDRVPWLAALAYVIDLPYKDRTAADRPDSALEWDRKALSRENYFSIIGVGLDPGNVVLLCMLLDCFALSGAAVHKVHAGYMDMGCAVCDKMPKLTEVLRDCAQASSMAQARLLLLCMQCKYPSLRYNPSCNKEKAGDVVEATGGVLSPYRASVAVVVRKLARLFPMSRDDVLDTVEDMGTLARRCKMLYHHVWWSETNEDARAQKA